MVEREGSDGHRSLRVAAAAFVAAALGVVAGLRTARRRRQEAARYAVQVQAQLRAERALQQHLEAMEDESSFNLERKSVTVQVPAVSCPDFFFSFFPFSSKADFN